MFRTWSSPDVISGSKLKVACSMVAAFGPDLVGDKIAVPTAGGDVIKSYVAVLAN